ncbi:MAG: DNA repair protein RecO, partial [Acidimicrobiales bacterium]
VSWWSRRRPRAQVSLYTDRGVVLRTYKFGEADRVVVLLSEQHGKVRAVAKGVRRTKSRFGSRLEPLSHIALLLWRGRGDLDVVNQVEAIDNFRSLREDLGRSTRAMCILEVVDQLAQQDNCDTELYSMLVGALRALADPDLDPTLVPAAFFLKALVLDGAAPVIERCASCSASRLEAPLVAFDITEGGALCARCRKGRSLSPEALDLMGRLLGGGLGEALRSAPPPSAAELSGLATEAMEAHLDRHLRAVRATEAL